VLLVSGCTPNEDATPEPPSDVAQSEKAETKSEDDEGYNPAYSDEIVRYFTPVIWGPNDEEISITIQAILPKYLEDMYTSSYTSGICIMRIGVDETILNLFNFIVTPNTAEYPTTKNTIYYDDKYQVATDLLSWAKDEKTLKRMRKTYPDEEVFQKISDDAERIFETLKRLNLPR
jgi:hypothetical protein